MPKLLRNFLLLTGDVTYLFRDTVRETFRRPFEFHLLMDQMYRLGVLSLPLVGMTVFFTGAVFALQVSFSLAAYGGRTYIGTIVSIAIVKELGPVLAGVMFAARVGAGISAEIGSMQVTEQVDALRALAASPIKKLVVPKVLALLIMLPALTLIADVLGIIGGAYVAMAEVGQTWSFFSQKVKEALLIGDLLSGTGKTFFFALFIGLIACRNGLKARGGADGVGLATTNTVVTASITIFISNYFLAKLFLFFQETFGSGGPPL
jgi:phospholipid/cholesterol/gamma-HCH transport system permease protein